MPDAKLAYYESLPYRHEISFDKEDNVWVVRFPELAGCVAHGDSREEALQRADEFKSEWLADAIESNQKIPEPEPDPVYSGRILLRLSKTLHEQATRIAAREGISLNQYMCQLIAQGVDRSSIGPAFQLFEELLKKEIGSLLPEESLKAIMVGIAVRVCGIYGDDQEPIPVGEQSQISEPSTKTEK